MIVFTTKFLCLQCVSLSDVLSSLFCLFLNGYNSQRAVNGKEVVVVSKIEESDVVSDLPSFGTATVSTSAAVEAQKIEEHEVVSDDEIQIPESQAQPTDSPTAASVVVPDDSLSDSEKIQQEVAATTLQAAFRGYLVIIS